MAEMSNSVCVCVLDFVRDNVIVLKQCDSVLFIGHSVDHTLRIYITSEVKKRLR